MSKKPSRNSKRGGKVLKNPDPGRPINARVWSKARSLAAEYSLVIEQDESVGGYLGRTIEFPYVMADGPTVSKCVAEVLEATTLCIATMLERGERPPSPASRGLRDQQVNLRLTAEERMRLDAAASREGFRSLSDYVRAAALNRAG